MDKPKNKTSGQAQQEKSKFYVLELQKCMEVTICINRQSCDGEDSHLEGIPHNLVKEELVFLSFAEEQIPRESEKAFGDIDVHIEFEEVLEEKIESLLVLIKCIFDQHILGQGVIF